MTKAVRITLITVSGAISTGIIGLAGYAMGKKKGIEIGMRQVAGDLNAASTEAPRNSHRAQAQA